MILHVCKPPDETGVAVWGLHVGVDGSTFVGTFREPIFTRLDAGALQLVYAHSGPPTVISGVQVFDAQWQLVLERSFDEVNVCDGDTISLSVQGRTQMLGVQL